MTKEPDRNPRKALGKGLSALLPRQNASVGGAAPAVVPETKPAVPEPIAPAMPAPPPLPEKFDEFVAIPLDQIRPNEDQPRTAFDLDKLQELSHSIQVNGLLQPITVYKVGPEQYRLIAGERRWRAARQAGLKAIPALVRSVEQQERLELALIENIQREDLNPIEIAAAFQSLATQHGLNHEQIAERTGKERSTVTNFLRLLRLHSDVQNALIRGEISMGHARVLLALSDDQQGMFARRIVEEGLSVRETERLVKEITTGRKEEPTSIRDSGKQSKPPAPVTQAAAAPTIDPNTRAALDAMAGALGTKVSIHAKSATSGKIEIEYYSQEDLDRIYSVIVE